AGCGKRADEAHTRIRRTADNLDWSASAGIHRQDTQLVRIRMLFSGQDLGDDEGLERSLVIDAFNLEPDHRQLLDDLIERGVRVEVILEPGKSEFHVAVLSLDLSL